MSPTWLHSLAISSLLPGAGCALVIALDEYRQRPNTPGRYALA